MDNKETFHYTYSAKQQEEIKAIRKKYMEAEEKEDKMTQLRRLDAGVTQKATVISLILGIIGTLILGVGMSLSMSEFGEIIGVGQKVSMFVGVVSGMIGLVLVCLAYPLYNRVIRKERERIAPEIIKLTDELMQ